MEFEKIETRIKKYKKIGGNKMSKYKIELKIKREDDIINLVEDYGYTEEEAEEVLQDSERLDEIFEEWIADNLDAGYSILEEE